MIFDLFWFYLALLLDICSCGRKATLNQRVTADGKPLAAGASIEVGGNERYVGKCRRHWYEGIEEAQ